MNIPKLWTKDFLIIMAENFFVYFTFYLLIVVIAIYASDKFHASPSIAGLSAGIFVIGAIFGRLYAGNSIEKIGHKKMLFFGFVFYLITSLLYFLANNIMLLIAFRLLHGAAFGLTSTATGTISAEIIPNERRGEGTGYYALSVTLAAAIGPFFGMLLTQHAGFDSILMVCSAVLSIGFMTAFFLSVPKFNVNSDELQISTAKKAFSFGSFFEVKAIPISIVTALVCFGYSSILSFLSSYAKSMNLIDIGSFFFFSYAVAILISRPFTGLWFDLKGENFIIYPTLFLFIIALVILGCTHSGFSILLAGVITGLGYGNYFAGGQALCIKVSPHNRRALAISTYFIAADAGSGIGPFLLGLLIPTFGYRGLYLSMAVLVFAASVLYYILHGRKKG